MASSSQHPHHLHQHQHQLLLQHQQNQHHQHHSVHHPQQQRPPTKPQNHSNPSPSPVMPYLAAAPSNPSSNSSSPAAQASEPHDLERPSKRQRTNASNLSMNSRLPPPPVNVAPPPQQQQQQRHHQQHPKSEPPPQQQQPQPPPPPSPVAPAVATSSSSVPFLRVQEQGSSETFALPLAAVPNWETLVSLLRDLFAKPPHSTPKLKTHRGDTIIKPLIKHFLKDGVHLSVAFDDHAPPPQQNTQSQPQHISAAVPPPPPPQSHHPSPVPPPLTITASNLSNNNNLNAGNGAGNQGLIPSPTFASPPLPSQNPPTPYSPPLHTSSTPSTSSSPLTAISTSLSFPAPSGQIPIYKMSRSLSTVTGLWQEWKQGLNGSPSVESLEARYGPKWRTSQAERKFYSRRKVIIEEITKRIASGMESWRAVELVEETRGGKSLDGLSKMIVERRKGAAGGGQGGRGRGRIGGQEGQVGEEEEEEENTWCGTGV